MVKKLHGDFFLLSANELESGKVVFTQVKVGIEILKKLLELIKMN